MALLCMASYADTESVAAGMKVFEGYCAGCHKSESTTLGPSLVGIVGKKVGTESSGVHSRAALESDFVWDRMLLRRFLTNPARDMPGTIMPAIEIPDAKQLEDLLNYLEALR